MRLVDATLKILGLSDAMRRWHDLLGELERNQREKIARYVDAIADSTARAASAFERLMANPVDKTARRAAVRELGRLSGYVEDVVATLDGTLDGRRLRGIRRRLEALASEKTIAGTVGIAAAHVERLVRAEGYFRALADALRAGRSTPSRMVAIPDLSPVRRAIPAAQPLVRPRRGPA
jgi:hypothetical protein